MMWLGRLRSFAFATPTATATATATPTAPKPGYGRVNRRTCYMTADVHSFMNRVMFNHYVTDVRKRKN